MGEYAKTYKEIDMTELQISRLKLRQKRIKLDIETYKYYREEAYIRNKWNDGSLEEYEYYNYRVHQCEDMIEQLEEQLETTAEQINDAWIRCGELQGYLQELRSIDGEDY